MSKYIQRTQRNEPTLQEKLRERLAQKFPQSPHAEIQYPSTSAILADKSGSMNSWLGANFSKMDSLRKILKDFSGARTFQFDYLCEELPPGKEVDDPSGGTDLHIALEVLKTHGISHMVLITDGHPSSPGAALKAAIGLRIDIFYVGPQPAPEFLAKLCAQTGGSYGNVSLSFPKVLSEGIKDRLRLGAGRTE